MQTRVVYAKEQTAIVEEKEGREAKQLVGRACGVEAAQKFCDNSSRSLKPADAPQTSLRYSKTTTFCHEISTKYDLVLSVL
jgi:hypothetical protein